MTADGTGAPRARAVRRVRGIVGGRADPLHAVLDTAREGSAPPDTPTAYEAPCTTTPYGSGRRADELKG
ncbi:hypothetical protein ACFVY1_33960 [Streptomyces sp. NPDC058293]|jgi:hypothetical protein|uniref:hypothetical protein n=1 Tax=Streptomyces sp. NPDC058293 TaxID=3346429 RepID=UPI0036ED8C16